MRQGRRLHPGGQRARVLPEEDQGQERQIDVQLFDTSIKSIVPQLFAVYFILFLIEGSAASLQTLYLLQSF